ncbi:hypothetical protein LSH36_250g03043 [Paralvinella palmiformis]|uniref:Uncharacterized protein n=1 Tax=Paralvinella palmiformis TaxID=53620 RepID=A0AAD9N5I2_9ANNE|nr:hypothetical protein LSH36_250g03043 [Paralvinella palmiformis]
MAIIGTGNKMLTSVVLCVYLILCTHSEARNPGVKIHLSKYGLNYAKEIAVDDLQKSIKNRGIPNHEDTSGDLSYRLSK